jgi:hypothetical protein
MALNVSITTRWCWLHLSPTPCNSLILAVWALGRLGSWPFGLLTVWAHGRMGAWALGQPRGLLAARAQTCVGKIAGL